MPEVRLSEFCKVLDGHGLSARLVGEDRLVTGVNTLDAAAEGEISFLTNPKYRRALETTRASAVIVGESVEVPDRLSALHCPDPYAVVTAAIITLHGHRKHPQWGVSQGAVIDSSARLGAGSNIAAGVTIAADVTIGDNCTLYPGCYIACGVTIGHDCTLYPNVVIYDHCELGNRVTIHAGSVIGEDGLGYAPRGDEWVKIPQVGRTVIGDDVEIGANCAVDRATLGQTEIGSGTKFGNVVVIGHGTTVGPHCLFVGQVGVAGSVTIGRHVMLAGQVGVAGHLTIGDHARIAAQSGISGNVEANADLFGSPGFPIGRAKRSVMVYRKLPEWTQRIKELERNVQELRRRIEGNGQG